MSRSRSRRASSSGSSARTGRGRRRSSTSSRVSSRRPRDGSSSPARTSRTRRRYRRTQAGLGRSFQVSSVFPLLAVEENVRLAAEAKLGGDLQPLRRAARYGPARERAARALAQVGLSDRSAWPAGMLSHGDKRKLEVAMLLAGDPRVILLDEPMAGVSVEDVTGSSS